MGGQESRRSGIFGDRDPAVFLRGQYVHQHCAGNLGDSVFVAGIYTGNGSSGQKVLQMQEQLNVIAGAYPAIPKIQADGIYGPATAEAVRTFQEVFGLPQTGTVDFRTWYKISEIYVGVSRIAELA